MSIDTDAPLALLIRGTASLEVVDGVREEYLAATRKSGSPG